MWAAFKALTWGAKLGILAAILLAIGSLCYVSYEKGVNVSRVEIQRYQTESNKLRADLAKAQGKVDVRVVTQYKDRVQTIVETEYKNRDVIRTKVVGSNLLTKGWVYAYNQTLAGLPVDPVLAADKTPSTTSELEALAATIAPNNAVSLENRAQVEALQNWIRETEASRKEVVDDKK